MNVSLTPELETLVQSKVQSGLYTSASEVVREALRLLNARDTIRPQHLAESKPLPQILEQQTLPEALEGLIGVVDSSKYNGGQKSHAAENSGEFFGEIIREKHKAGHL